MISVPYPSLSYTNFLLLDLGRPMATGVSGYGGSLVGDEQQVRGRSRERSRERSRHHDRDRDYRSGREREREKDRDRDRDRNRDKDGDRDRDRDWEREHRRSHSRERDRDREHHYRRSRSRSRSRDRDRRSRRHFEERSDNGHSRQYRDGGGSGAGSSRRGRDRSPIALFDKYAVENLSPFRGVTIGMEHRQRILNNWDAAPPGFERISADKAKLTGLFPPPGNIAKITNFVPPVLDPTKAAMLAMLTNTTAEEAAGGAASFLASGAAMFAPALAKQARRVYVGNIPASCNEEEIAEHFNRHLNAILPSPMGTYVLGVEISGDRDYAFVDFRSPEEADFACRLHESVFQGHTLTVRRTREFSFNTSASALEPQAEAVETNQLVISGLPTCLGEAHLKYLLAPFGQSRFLRLLIDERRGGLSYGVAVLEMEDTSMIDLIQDALNGFSFDAAEDGSGSALKVCKLTDCVDDQEVARILSIFSLTPGKATCDPSPVLQLLNMVTADELSEENEYVSILEDIRDECAQCGEVLSILIPRPGTEGPTAGVGKVFVEFRSVDDCMRAIRELAGRRFADRTVLASYYPPEKFAKAIF